MNKKILSKNYERKCKCPSITMRHRNRIWEDMMSHLNSLGAKIEGINQLHSKKWNYLRRATMQKFAKSLKTGARFDCMSSPNLDNTFFVGDSRYILQDSIQNKPSMGALKNLKTKQARESLLVDGSLKNWK
ncbi:uncharacterized protein LOC136090348 [Hydra vulgaris]|uniref:Uncharacterized protein LOC136090348 n=1 Tax=Hydra vulgaris TaxID=6087 RepID=A0ABM4DF21_HYDVU